MARSINKWLTLSIAGFFSVVQVSRSEYFAQSFERQRKKHPLHVSTTEINHNATDKSLEISCRLFVDDFEACLSKQYHTKADLSASNVKTAMDSLVKRYLLTHLQIKADNKIVRPQYLGFEKEDEAVNAFLEVDQISAVKKIDVMNSILHDFYDDETNIIHVVVGGNRKSTKLDYPNKEASFSF